MQNSYPVLGGGYRMAPWSQVVGRGVGNQRGLSIIPSEKWLSIEYLRTNTVALLFWSDWHTRALGCLFFEEYGEAMLSCLLMRSKEVANPQSVQQTTEIF